MNTTKDITLAILIENSNSLHAYNAALDLYSICCSGSECGVWYFKMKKKKKAACTDKKNIPSRLAVRWLLLISVSMITPRQTDSDDELSCEILCIK